MSLRFRLGVVLLVVLLLSTSVVWFVFRPMYESAILEERLFLVGNFQEQQIKSVDYQFGMWVSTLNQASQLLINNPEQLEAGLQAYFSLFPEIRLFRITQLKDGEFLEVRPKGNEATLLDRQWLKTSLSLPKAPEIKLTWVEKEGLILIHRDIVDGAYQIVMTIDDASVRRMLFEETRFQGLKAAVWNGDMTLGDQVEFPRKTKSTTQTHFVESDSLNLAISTGGFSIIPFWYSMIIDQEVFLEPVRTLARQMLLLILGIVSLMGVGGWFILGFIQKPLDQLRSSVQPMHTLDFTHPIKNSGLPEFSLMENVLNDIRLKLKHFQEINIEEIVIRDEKTRQFISHASEGVALLDNEGNYFLLNHTFRQLLIELGSSEKESFAELRNHPAITINNEQTSTEKSGSIRIEKTQSEWFIEFEEENVQQFGVYEVELFSKSGVSSGKMIVLFDLTKQFEINKMRNEMISLIVHELRNPVTGVLGLVDIIKNPELYKSNGEEFLGLMNKSLNQMLQLINRFLDISKLEAESLQIQKEPILLPQILSTSIDRFSAQLKAKKCGAAVNITQDAEMILASEQHLLDVINNLFSNAIKYGGENRTIELSAFEKDNGVAISITDFGYGISEEDQKKIFNKFYRVKQHSAEVGTGLGLTFVKEVMNKHNGTIRVESNNEIGTRFELWFPSENMYDEVI